MTAHDSDLDAKAIHSLTVQRLAVSAEVHLSDLAGVRDSIEAAVAREIDGLIIGIRAFVLAESHDRKIAEVKHWASWWDHFKNDKFPNWLLERFPAETVTETVFQPLVIRTCPHVAVKRPNIDHFRFVTEGKS